MGGWHIVALNSNCLWAGGCGADSAQVAWLRRDLQAHPNACTLAFWHHPRFSSGRHGSSDTYKRVSGSVLDEAGVDVVLSAHDHHYERFAPQRADGTLRLGGYSRLRRGGRAARVSTRFRTGSPTVK